MSNLNNFEIVYINLDKDEAKKEKMESLCKELGFNYRRFSAIDGNASVPSRMDLDFKEPRQNRNQTKGELGCMLSHIAIWKSIAADDKIVLILEDDAIINQPIELIKSVIFNAYTILSNDYEFCYLGRQPLQGIKESRIEIYPGFIEPRYSWLTHAYMVSPKGAKKLLSKPLLYNRIIADEWIPYMIGSGFADQLLRKYGEPAKKKRVKALAYVDNELFWQDRIVCSQTESSPQIFKNGIDPSKQSYVMLTVATDPNNLGFKFLCSSAVRNNWQFSYNIGDDITWNGGTMEGPGGGQKVNILKDYLLEKKYPDDTIILFTDGYDSFINDTPYNVIRRWLENFDYKNKVLFAAEKVCWPDKSNAQAQKEKSSTDYHYLNSGCFIGRVQNVLEILQKSIVDSDDDQLYYQNEYLNGSKIELDHDCKIFQCLSEAVAEIDIDPEQGTIFNGKQKASPQIIHGNGGQYTKERFFALAQTIDDIHNPKYYQTEI